MITQERVKTFIIAGLIITAVTWTMDVIDHVLIDNQGDLITSFFKPGLNESTKRLAIIIIVLSVIGYFAELTKNNRNIVNNAVKKGAQAAETLKQFKSLLPTCPTCDSIRDNIGLWHELDIYMEKYPEAIYTEKYCPGCTRNLNTERFSKEMFIGKA